MASTTQSQIENEGPFNLGMPNGDSVNGQADATPDPPAGRIVQQDRRADAGLGA